LTHDDWQLLADGVVDYAIFMLDREGRVATWSLGAQRIEGYSAAEIVGQHVSKFYPDEDVAAGKPQRQLELAREQGRVEDEGWRIHEDGTRLWANVLITALRDESGELRGFGMIMRDLTARRAEQEQLRQSEERFHLLVDLVSDYAIFLLDPEGHVSTWNVGAKRIKGYTQAEILGQHFSVFYPEDGDRARRCDGILEHARLHGRYEEEGWRIRKDGSRFWASVVITALRNERKQLVGFAKITRDLTERRKSEETARELIREQTARAISQQAEGRIRESEDRYRDLSRRLEVVFEGVVDGITVQDGSGKVVFANTAAARSSGFDSVDEFLRTPTSEILERFELLDEQGRRFAPGDLPARKVLLGQEAADAVIRVRERATGRERWSYVRARAVPGLDGGPNLAINIWHDVTLARRSEQHERLLSTATAALSASLDREAMLGASARVLVPEIADWCAISVLEEGALRNVALVHTDPAKLAKATEIRQRLTPDPAAERGLWSTIRSGRGELYEEISDDLLRDRALDQAHLTFLRAVGTTSAITAPICVRERAIGAFSLISAESQRRYDQHDLSFAEELGRRMGTAIENARLYKAAQEAAKKAEEASRLKDEFLATVSHELRTPLNAIAGWAALLQGHSHDPHVEKGLDVIRRNAQAQTKIIEDILDVSRVINGKFRLDPRPTDLVAVTRDALEVVRHSAAGKQIALEFQSEADAYLLIGDPERLQQVIWNLLSNAVKFTDTGGAIRVTIEQDGSSLELSVADTGKGIDPSFLPFVFDRFKQGDASTTRRFGGLGLGLALVRHIVELHGGRVEASSQGLGRGATFRITLPIRAIAPRTAPAEKTSSSETSPPTSRALMKLHGLRVLVVDDDADARELLRIALINAGGSVEVAESAAEAIEALRDFHPHVLISDIGMPGEDGYTLMERVRRLGAAEGGAIPSVALTAYTRAEDRRKALAAGFATHLAKPIEPDDLVSTVAHLGRARHFQV
jgi:PAS domain S-box-containing protein